VWFIYFFFFFFFLIVFFFIYFFNNNSEPVVPTSSGGTTGSSGGTTGSNGDPKGKKKKNNSFMINLLFFFLYMSFIFGYSFLLFYFVYYRSGVVYFNIFGEMIPSHLVVFDHMPRVFEYAPLSYWEDYIRVYIDPGIADYMVRQYGARGDTLVFSRFDIEDIIRLLNGG